MDGLAGRAVTQAVRAEAGSAIVAEAVGGGCALGTEMGSGWWTCSGKGQMTSGVVGTIRAMGRGKSMAGDGDTGTTGVPGSGAQMGSRQAVSGECWAQGTGCGLGCGSGGIGGVDTGDGDGADGADQASSGTQGIGTQAEGKGSGRVTGLAGVIGRAQGSMESGSTGLARTWHGSGAGCKGRGCMTGAVSGKRLRRILV